jgi:hypothetical protein
MLHIARHIIPAILVAVKVAKDFIPLNSHLNTY